jgi:hypothetical protein
VQLYIFLQKPASDKDPKIIYFMKGV